MQVPNLSLLSFEERQRILERAQTEKVCGTFLVRLSGEMVTPEKPLTPKERLGIRQLGLAALSAGALAVATGCVSPQQTTLATPTTEAATTPTAQNPASTVDNPKTEEETIILMIGLIICEKPAPVRPKLPNGKW